MAEPQRIAVIGVGKVGAPLAAQLARAGHHVVIGESRPGSDSARRAVARDARLSVRSVEEAVAGSEIVFLATPFGAAEGVLTPLATALAGKVLVDCTNPIGPNMAHLFASAKSGSAVVQAAAPGAHVVKAFTVYGFENLENSTYPGYDVRPAMPICGDSPVAKANVAGLVRDCGFEPVDVGSLAQAVHLEHMTLLWIRMVRIERHVPDLTWAALRRPIGAS